MTSRTALAAALASTVLSGVAAAQSGRQMMIVERDDEVVEFTRTHNGQTLWVALNMGQSAVSIQPPAGAQIIREAFLSSDTESLAPLTGTVWSL